jgi:hypothetical protein
MILKEQMTNEAKFSELFSLLPATENPRHSRIQGISYVLHEDHRWLLPIVHFAQELGELPKPCTLVMFDAHMDSIKPDCMEILGAARPNLTPERLVDICRNHLRILDDDWIKAGMELGIFGDAIVFGGWHPESTRHADIYKDLTSQNHRFLRVGLPLNSLAYQGEMSDLAHASSPKYQYLWKTLGWQLDGYVFDFVKGVSPILLSVDLDCFAAHWHGYNFPWPDEIFETEFLEQSNYSTTRGWTGKRFLTALAQKAGLVTFAREAACTDGAEKGRHILERLNRYVFDGSLPSAWYPPF